MLILQNSRHLVHDHPYLNFRMVQDSHQCQQRILQIINRQTMPNLCYKLLCGYWYELCAILKLQMWLMASCTKCFEFCSNQKRTIVLLQDLEPNQKPELNSSEKEQVHIMHVLLSSIPSFKCLRMQSLKNTIVRTYCILYNDRSDLV